MKFRRVKVEVTEKDIRSGYCGDPDRCPVARAGRMAIGNKTIWAGGGALLLPGDINNNFKTTTLARTERLRRFIVAYDKHRRPAGIEPRIRKFPRNVPLTGALKPFSFIAKVPLP